MAIAKGLGGGYQPIGAVLVQERIVDASPTAAASSSTATLTSAIRSPAPRRWRCRRSSAATTCSTTCARRARDSRARLQERFGDHPQVGDIRGRGLFMAIELVADRATKEPFDPALQLHARIKREAMARGLMVYPMGGTIDGSAATTCCSRRRSSLQRRRSTRSSSGSATAIDAALASAVRPTREPLNPHARGWRRHAP